MSNDKFYAWVIKNGTHANGLNGQKSHHPMQLHFFFPLQNVYLNKFSHMEMLLLKIGASNERLDR